MSNHIADYREYMRQGFSPQPLFPFVKKANSAQYFVKKAGPYKRTVPAFLPRLASEFAFFVGKG